jgi:hypothetical protein
MNKVSGSSMHMRICSTAWSFNAGGVIPVLQFTALVHDIGKLFVAVWSQLRETPQLWPSAHTLDFSFKTVLFPT